MNALVNLQYAKLLTEKDHQLLPPLLAATLANVARFDTWRIAIVDTDCDVSVIDFRNNLRTDNSEHGVDLSADMIPEVAHKAIGDGFYNSQELAPRGLQRTEYYEQSLKHGLVLTDHAGYVAKVDEENTICISFSRSDHYSMFTEAENDKFRAISPLILHALRLIWKAWSADPKNTIELRARTARTRLDAALQSFGFTTLTPRERDVAQLLVSGHSAKAIARVLDIGPGTARNHIKHIYLKLGLSSRSELFSRYVKELMLCQTA